MAKLSVHRKGYTRKAYTRKAYTRKGGVHVKAAKVGKSRVPASTYKIKDRGKPGRGRKVIPPLKPKALGVSFDWPTERRRKALITKAKRYGEKKVVGRLRAIQVLNKRTNPKVSRIALADSKFVAGSFKRKRYVGFPKGFGRNP